MARTFREMFKFALPARFTAGEGGLLQGVIAMVLDASLERARAAVLASLPTQAGDSALALHGADRAIPRGRSETREHYAQRLLRWRWPRGHRVRGNDWALLEQVAEYFGGMQTQTIDASSNTYTRTIDGVLSWVFGAAGTWAWYTPTAPPSWGRFWIKLDATVGVPGTVITATPAFGDPTLWGGGYGVLGQCVGLLGITTYDVQAIRALMLPPTPWKPAGVRGEWVIVNITGTTATPDATWANWSKVVGGVRSASRYAGWRYWSLTPAANNDYTPVAANATTPCIFLGPINYTPVAANALSTIVLPDGTVYTPNAANARPRVHLIDDGSQA